jgi:hypothetical protein
MSCESSGMILNIENNSITLIFSLQVWHWFTCIKENRTKIHPVDEGTERLFLLVNCLFEKRFLVQLLWDDRFVLHYDRLSSQVVNIQREFRFMWNVVQGKHCKLE